MENQLEKEAFLNPHLLQGFKNVALSSKPIIQSAKKAPIPVNGTTAARVEGGVEKMFSPEEIAAKIKERDISEGNGFVSDLLLGSVKGMGNLATRTIKKDKGVEWSGASAIDNASAKVKEVSRDFSTKVGQGVIDMIGGNNPGSKRGRIFSTLEDVQIGERTLADGSVAPIIEKQRRASIGAPLQNTMKAATPLLGSMYLAEKMYPQETREDTPSVAEMTGAAQQLAHPASQRIQHMPRIASDEVVQMEKKAMLDKQAQLEDELMEKTAEIHSLRRDLDWMEKRASDADERAVSFEKRASVLQDELFEKTAEHKELLLRVAARERSGEAVKIARAMLEKGMIKRAQYEQQIDKLMDCPEEELLLFEKMASSEKDGEESLETLAFLSDTYSSSDEQPRGRVAKGLSKSGQTILEAAREINASRNGG